MIIGKIKDIIDGAKTLQEGSEEVKKLEEHAQQLFEEHLQLEDMTESYIALSD